MLISIVGVRRIPTGKTNSPHTDRTGPHSWYVISDGSFDDNNVGWYSYGIFDCMHSPNFYSDNGLSSYYVSSGGNVNNGYVGVDWDSCGLSEYIS